MLGNGRPASHRQPQLRRPAHHNPRNQVPFPAAGPQGYPVVLPNMNPHAAPSSALNRQNQNPRHHHGALHQPAANAPSAAPAASNEHQPGHYQNQPHQTGASAAATAARHGHYLSESQDSTQPLDRDPTITPHKVGTLVCVRNGRKSIVELTTREYVIGRAIDCDVVLTSPECSKRHCKIFVLAEPSQQPQMDEAPSCVWMILDSSTNGTFVNGKRLPKNQPLPLYTGDLIEIKVGNHFEFISQYAKYPDPNEELKDPEYNSVHEQYLLTRKLGSGTYASVYLAQQLATGRRYACKVVNKRKAGLPERRSGKLVQEIEVIRHFNHPNIIRVHNYIETRLYLYVVMDLAQSGELFDYLAAQYGIEEPKCKMIMYQIFVGLRYLHENKVVHRDIKPENVLLDFSGEYPRVMLADFGLAKRRNTAGPQHFTTLCGTLNYLAPEVISPSARAQGYDDVVDCWAAGVMLFFLLTCRHPFDDDNDRVLKDKIIRGHFNLYAPASDGGNLFDHLSLEVGDLITKLLVRDPAERLSAREALKHPWFQSSLQELKAAYKVIHESWEAQAQKAPPSTLTTAEPIRADELFTQSQTPAAMLAVHSQAEEIESEMGSLDDAVTVRPSERETWIREADNEEEDEDAMDQDSSERGQDFQSHVIPPTSTSMLPGQFVSSQPSELQRGLEAFAGQFGGGSHQNGHGHLTTVPADRHGSIPAPHTHSQPSSPPPLAGGSSFMQHQYSMSKPEPSSHMHLHARAPSEPSVQFSSSFAARMNDFMSQYSQPQPASRFQDAHSNSQHAPSFSASQPQAQTHHGGFSAAGQYTGTPYPSFGAAPVPVNMPPVPHHVNNGSAHLQHQSYLSSFPGRQSQQPVEVREDEMEDDRRARFAKFGKGAY